MALVYQASFLQPSFTHSCEVGLKLYRNSQITLKAILRSYGFLKFWSVILIVSSKFSAFYLVESPSIESRRFNS